MHRAWLLWCALVLGGGCAESGEEPVSVPLLDPWALVPVDAAADPLADHRPDLVNCPPPAWGPEGGAFEIETGVCEYGAFSQPLTAELLAGDEIEIVVWHDLLDAPEPGRAHLAVTIGRDVVWEADVDIPAPSAALQERVTLDSAPAADATLGLHLHNHGYNTWRFVSVELSTP